MTEKIYPLHTAIIESDESKARELIVGDANLSEHNEDDWTPLHLCSQNNNDRIARWLINAGAKINTRNSKGVTPLHSCAWTNSIQVANLLLSNGANSSLKDESSWTALMLAAWNNHHKIIQLLLENGASINARSKTGSTSLHFAAYNNSPLALETLLEKKAAVNVVNNDGHTAYDLAVRKQNQECIDLLEQVSTLDKTRSANQLANSPIQVNTEDYFNSEVGVPAGDTLPLVEASEPDDEETPQKVPEKEPTAKIKKTQPEKPKAKTKEPPAPQSEVADQLVNKDSFFLDSQEVDMPFLTELTKEQARLSSDGSSSEVLFPEQLINVTLNGDKVRRKSEVVIANLLFSFDINYVYERKLCGTVAIGINYPAFSIFTKDDRIIVWEHISSLTTGEKRKQFNQLKRWYKLNGFIEGQTFFTTQDTLDGGVDSPAIYEVVEAIANQCEQAEQSAGEPEEEATN